MKKYLEEFENLFRNFQKICKILAGIFNKLKKKMIEEIFKNLKYPRLVVSRVLFSLIFFKIFVLYFFASIIKKFYFSHSQSLLCCSVERIKKKKKSEFKKNYLKEKLFKVKIRKLKNGSVECNFEGSA